MVPALRLRRGLSLMEVVLATSVLGLVAMMIFQIYPTSFVAVQAGRHRMEAEGWADSLLEQERGAAFGSLVVGSERYPERLVVGDGTVYTACLRVKSVDGLQTERLVAIEAEVSWKDGTGEHRIVMETYVAKLR